MSLPSDRPLPSLRLLAAVLFLAAAALPALAAEAAGNRPAPTWPRST